MNLQHLSVFLWLRWRIRVNQFRRGGALNAALLVVAAVAVAGAAVFLFVGGFFAGLFGLPAVAPEVRLYIWDGVVGAFLFSWMIGLMTDLQRSESLSLDKFLHLPVSPAGAFLINYLSSLLSLTLAVFVPAMIGLALGQAVGLGAASLLALPLLAAFVLAVTAVTYLFQGWLAALMSNPRRRRTVVVLLTLAVVLISQAPQMIGMFLARRAQQEQLPPPPTPGERRAEIDRWYAEQYAERSREWKKGEITAEESRKRGAALEEQYRARLAELEREQQNQTADATRQREERLREQWEAAERAARLINVALPPGWLPLGAAGLTDGEVWPALLGTLGFALIGTVSLWRGYRTTIRIYTGQIGAGEAKSGGRPRLQAPPRRPRMVEWVLPWVSEHAAAVAAAGLRSLTRAPEAKMMLVGPVILVVIFASVTMTAPFDPPEAVRPLMATGAMTFILVMGIQLVGNQFGYDRAGFRVYVLSPAPRREILLGKNLAAAPLVLGLGLVTLIVFACLFPMRIDHLFAALAQLVAMYLLFCMLANGMSILVPVPIAPGALQPTNPRVDQVLLQMAVLMLLPVVLAPTLIPLGVEVLLEEFAGWGGVPVMLILELAVLAAVVLCYRLVLTWEGELLAAREQKVLEVVTSKAE
jgi:hypothetical protein